MNMQVKKKLIRPFRSSSSSVNVEEKWACLEQAIGQIHRQDASLLSFEQLYRYAYHLVLSKQGDFLYANVVTCVKQHLRQTPLLTSHHKERLVQSLQEIWLNHKTTMKMLKEILMYMDRTYVLQTQRTPIYDKGIVLFHEIVLTQSDQHDEKKDQEETVGKRLVAQLLQMIRSDRQGEIVDKSLIRDSLSMLVELGIGSLAVYEQEFERGFLQETAQFYQQEAQAFLATQTIPEYLLKVESRLLEEAERVSHYLHSTTESKLRDLVENELIVNYSNTILESSQSGARVLCLVLNSSATFDDRLEHLSRMVNLFSRPKKKTCKQTMPPTALMKDLARVLQQCITASGLEIMNKYNIYEYETSEKKNVETNSESAAKVKIDPIGFVEEILNLRSKYEQLVTVAFCNCLVAQKALKNGFEDFLNVNRSCAAYLAEYLNDFLRSGLKHSSIITSALSTKSKSDQQMENLIIDEVIMVFHYLQDKDIFEEYYKQHLAKRLLQQKSNSEEMEKKVIAKLKAECGYQFTSKLEGKYTFEEYYTGFMEHITGMMKDMKISKETMDLYRTQGGDFYRSTLHVSVLTSGFWPSSANTNTNTNNFPVVIQDMVQQFQRFYHTIHNGRRLAWHTQLGTADMKWTNHQHNRKKELNVSTYQMCILLLFNTNKKLTFKYIQENTGITDESELKRHLISLCVPKYRLLKKKSKGKGISSESDSFELNDNFTSKLLRVKVPLISAKDRSFQHQQHQQQDLGIPETVQEDRKYLIEAAIVRIMKTRKRLDHLSLVTEVTRQLLVRFKPDPTLIKRRIESLIDREYLERSQDRKIYNYLA